MKIDEQGVDTRRYQVIVRTLIFIFYKDEILLLKGSTEKKIWAGKYNGIGGHVEAGEDVLSSARRELMEETGITEIPLKLRGNILINIPATPGILLFVFRGSVDSKSVKAGIEGDLHWVKVNQISELDLVEDLLMLIPKVVDTNVDYFSASYSYENDQLVIKFAD